MCPIRKDIRSSIALFIKLLCHFGFTSISSEDFRLAKYNDPLATRPLLRLLYEFLYFYQHDSIDHICREGFDKFSLFDIAIYTSKRLRTLGYPSPHSSSHTIFSRELLLQIGWVFCHCNLLHKMESLLFRRACEPEFGRTSFAISPNNNVSLSELTWSLGRLRLRLKELCLVRSAILKRNEFSLDKNRFASQCTPMEYLMINSPGIIEDRVRCMEEISVGLSLLISWQCSSCTFWQWMHSVMILHLSSEDDAIPSIDDSIVQRLREKRDTLDGCLREFASLHSMSSMVVLEPRQSIDHLLSQVHINLGNLSRQLECKIAMPTSFLAPLHWTYNLIADSKCLGKTKDEPSHLTDECKKLNAILQSAMNGNHSLRDEMLEYLNNFAAQSIPDVLFLHSSVGTFASP